MAYKTKYRNKENKSLRITSSKSQFSRLHNKHSRDFDFSKTTKSDRDFDSGAPAGNFGGPTIQPRPIHSVNICESCLRSFGKLL